MIQLLFPLIYAEMAMIVIFVFKTPLRKLVIMGFDRVKRGRGKTILKTIGGMVFVMMMSNVYSIVKIQNRRIEDGDLNPTDQYLWFHLNITVVVSFLKQSFELKILGLFTGAQTWVIKHAGFSLFLALMIDRLHHYMRELPIWRKSMEGVHKQNQAFDDGKGLIAERKKALEEELTTLRAKINWLESEVEAKTKEANNSESNALALKTQSEELLLEYDRLLEDNQNLRNQLQSLDRRL
ncbi:hypothetical protein U1Q18_010940 [Sarracenia purpurea var. burkii]